MKDDIGRVLAAVLAGELVALQNLPSETVIVGHDNTSIPGSVGLAQQLVPCDACGAG